MRHRRYAYGCFWGTCSYYVLTKTTDYVYDAFGRLMAEYGSGTTSSPCGTCYVSTDMLGSTRLMTNETGVVKARYDFLPFGQEILPPPDQNGNPVGRGTVLCGSTSCYSQSGAITQKLPVLNAVVNAASFKPGVAPGSIISIFGTNVASGTETAATLPLPPTLQGAAASVNGLPMPLFYANPTQINAQLPYNLAPGSAFLTLHTPSGDAPLPFTVAAANPGVFSFGVNRAVAFNPNGSLNDATHPAAAGDVLVVYLTGIGPVDNAIPDGSPASASPLSKATLPYSATIGSVAAPVSFLGLTPTFVGLVQANVQVPNVGPGDRALIITVGGSPSASMLLTIR